MRSEISWQRYVYINMKIEKFDIVRFSAIFILSLQFDIFSVNRDLKPYQELSHQRYFQFFSKIIFLISHLI